MLGFLIAIGIISIIVIAIFITIKVYKSFAINHSNRIKKLIELNYKYRFYDFVSNNQEHTYDNENFYNDISEQDYLIYQLQFISSKVNEQIKLMRYNSDLKFKYQIDLKEIKNDQTYDKVPKGFILKLLNKIEEKAFDKLIQEPCTNYYVEVTLKLSKINGEVYRKKSMIFYSEDILQLIKRLNNKRGSFHNDRGIWEAICRVERGKVTNKMRFAVYQRDGYRCRYCHRGENKVTLEVDHIYPIAKGGKSTFENLQTLCHDCNVKKGDSIY